MAKRRRQAAEPPPVRTKAAPAAGRRRLFVWLAGGLAIAAAALAIRLGSGRTPVLEVARTRERIVGQLQRELGAALRG